MEWYQFIKIYKWWRYEHQMTILRSMSFTLQSLFIYPLSNIKSWIWIRTIGRYIYYPKIKRIEEEIRDIRNAN